MRGRNNGQLRIVSLPKDPNPYQELLYQPMRRAGVVVEYAGELTGSRTVNQLALPLELAWRRLLGFRVLHIHWLFGFRFAYAHRFPVLLKLSRLWLALVLRVARLLGYRIVWTAHNVLPHAPIFDDDAAARRTLTASCDLVIAHAANSLSGLRQIGAAPGRSTIIPPGTYDLPQFAQLRRPPARPPTVVLSFGQVSQYKGVEDLLEAVGQLDGQVGVVVAGNCPDPGLRAALEAAGAELGHAATLLLRYVDDEEVAPLFERAHAVVLPFRAVTTSSSVMLALASGRPVVLPDLPAFADIPDAALIRYPAGTDGLRQALERIADASDAELAEIGRAGREFARRNSWDDIARRTSAAFETLVAPAHEARRGR
jgi:glycosyltransferase involved in cell wall biosynthesis